MRRIVVGISLVVLVLVAFVAPSALAQEAQQPSVSAKLLSQRRHAGRIPVLFSGSGWGARLGTACGLLHLRATSTAGGAAQPITTVHVDPPATTFKRAWQVRLVPGSYVVTATQACTRADGSAAPPGTAQTSLTIT
jgi:hypothetical protein